MATRTWDDSAVEVIEELILHGDPQLRPRARRRRHAELQDGAECSSLAGGKASSGWSVAVVGEGLMVAGGVGGVRVAVGHERLNSATARRALGTKEKMTTSEAVAERVVTNAALAR